MPPTAALTPLQRYLPWRLWAEVGFWLALTLLNTFANTVTVLIDIHRVGLGVAAWQPAVWEASSSLLWLALVLPVAAFTRRYPLQWGDWGAQMARHAAASVVVSLAHVLGMVALRHAAYRAMGSEYHFGPWGPALFYEYLKDARSYLGMVVTIESYRLLLRRLQGEASVLDAAEAPLPAASEALAASAATASAAAATSASAETASLTAPAPATALEAGPEPRPQRLLVRKLNREFLIAVADIEWLQAEGNYVKLHVAGHDYLLRSTITAIAARLDPARFVRIHRSYIVNLDRLASIEPLDSGDARAHLRGGQVLPCSRSYRAELRERGALA